VILTNIRVLRLRSTDWKSSLIGFSRGVGRVLDKIPSIGEVGIFSGPTHYNAAMTTLINIA
jgi:hypothetical protein